MAQFELREPEDDGLYIAEVGAWSRSKHHFLRRYLHAFTEAMKSKPWDSLHYIDLFAGPGIERLKARDREYGLDWGSPLVAAQMPTKFHGLHFIELDQRKFAALNERLARFPQPTCPRVLHGNCNELIDEILSGIPPRALSTAFLDPYGLHLNFETLRKLAGRRMDLIIFFPDHVDALRNWGTAYKDNHNSNLDRFLGTSAWRDRKDKTNASQWPEMLLEIYDSQIKSLGYLKAYQERINRTDGRPLYKLLFFSKHVTGGRIWSNIARRKQGGQDSFDFDAHV